MSVYSSVDPAPALVEKTVEHLRSLLLNATTATLFERYKAMFALRNRNTPDAVRALCDSLDDKSALFRHEVCFVLGQMQNPLSFDDLVKVVRNETEHAMVRHEAAEALGALEGSEAILAEFAKHNAPIIRESVEVALDINEYNASSEFQYGGFKELLATD